MGRRWIAAVLLLLAADAGAKPQFNPNEVIVFADSEAVRSVYAQPVTSDLFALLVARETFRMARDEKAEKALDEYLARVGLLALAGQAVAPSGTIERIVTDPAALPAVPAELAARILSAALTPRLAGSVDAEKHLPDSRSSFQTHKREYPGVWSNWRQGSVDSVQVFVHIENTGPKLITQFDTGLRIDGESGEKPFELRCQPSPWFDRVAPGESRLHVCHVGGDRVAIPNLVRAVRAAEKDPSRWRLALARINYADPAVNFSGRGVYYWLDSGKAAQQASLNLEMAGCQARGSCWEDFLRKLNRSPQFVLIPGGAFAGFLLGWLVARVARRPAIWGVLISLLVAGGLVAVVLGIFATARGMDAVAALFVAVYGAAVVAPFVVGLWLAIATMRKPRPDAVTS